MHLLIYVPVFFVLLLVYFRLAVAYDITDRPNQRSSHTKTTIRGGGIIFPLSFIIFSIFSGFSYPLFTTGLMLLALISFYDDSRPLGAGTRFLFHAIAAGLLFSESSFWNHSAWLIALAFVLIIGIINAYNFMDGINGMTALYSLTILLSLYIINAYFVEFTSSDLLIICCMSVSVFGFFNLRKKAICFAGDVGSITIAFIAIFFILLLIIRTEDMKYVCLLLVYGLDSVTTIIFRLIRKENIFQAHRSHFYQYLVNTRLWPHLKVASLYSVAQLFVNVIVLQFSPSVNVLVSGVILSGVFFVAIRFAVEGRATLVRPRATESF